LSPCPIKISGPDILTISTDVLNNNGGTITAVAPARIQKNQKILFLIVLFSCCLAMLLTDI
jgi:hypothetical protein